jgi:hypothetical protein
MADFSKNLDLCCPYEVSPGVVMSPWDYLYRIARLHRAKPALNICRPAVAFPADGLLSEIDVPMEIGPQTEAGSAIVTRGGDSCYFKPGVRSFISPTITGIVAET